MSEDRELSRAAEVLEHERREFRTRTPRSRERYERALNVLPGADTRSVTFYPPYPAVIQSASGIELERPRRERLQGLPPQLHLDDRRTRPPRRRRGRPGGDGARHGDRRAGARPARAGRGARPARRRVSSGCASSTPAPRRRWPPFESPGRSRAAPLVVKVTGGYHGSYPDLDITLRPGFYPAGVPESTPTRLAPYNDPDALEAVLGRPPGSARA